MWYIFLIATYLGAAAAGHKTPVSYAPVKPLPSLRDEASATATFSITTETTILPGRPSTALNEIAASSAKPAESATKREEEMSSAGAAVTGQPTVAPLLTPTEVPGDGDGDTGKRRVITYDQRQEGQYNIRADLENFMIVFIPPSPAEGLSILDLLSKSALRRSSSSHGSKPRRRLGYVDSSGEGPRFQQSMKTGDNNQNFNYLQRQSGSLVASPAERYHHQQKHLQTLQSSGSVSSTPFQNFVEGRTPYHVDIAADSENSRLQPDRQVDVLPPSYPLAYQHLIKPFHLEAEPAVIQALPPGSAAKNAKGNPKDLLESYNQLLAASSLQDVDGDDDLHSTGSRAKLPPDTDFYRVSRSRSSRALRGDGLLESNSATASNSLLAADAPDALSAFYARSTHLPIFRSDLAFGAGSRYPPIDVPRLSGYINIGSSSRTLALDSAEERADLEEGHAGEIVVPAPGDDELDLDLNNASFSNTDAKSLLSDDLERCAPGRRRDSYGVCREIEGY